MRCGKRPPPRRVGGREAVSGLGTGSGRKRRKVFRGCSAKEASDRRREYLDRRARGEGEAATTTRLNVAGWMERWLAGPVEASVATGAARPRTGGFWHDRHRRSAYYLPWTRPRDVHVEEGAGSVGTGAGSVGTGVLDAEEEQRRALWDWCATRIRVQGWHR